MPDPYISEIKYLGAGTLDFIEVAVDQGLDVSNIQVVIYNNNGTVRSIDNLGTLNGTMAGRDVYVIDEATAANFTGIHQNGAVALVVDGTVVSFLSFNQSVTATAGPANGMSSTALGRTGRDESFETTDNGASYGVQSTPNSGTVPCFLSGTRIRTDKGEVPVECLRAGDRVLTLDDGYQPVLWAGMRQLTLDEGRDPAQRPVRIPAGALAPGLPMRDLYLSPNHRAMLSHPLCALFFQQDDVLAAAKSLMGARGIGHGPVALPVRYHHLLLGRHQVLFANGVPCESFMPEEIGLSGFPPADRTAIAQALGRQGSYGPTVRMVAKPAEVRLLLDRAIGAPLCHDGPRTLSAAA